MLFLDFFFTLQKFHQNILYNKKFINERMGLDMFYVMLNDASLFEITDIIEETKVKLQGETLKAISMRVQNADLDLIRTAFSSEFNVRTVTLMSEGKVAMTVYNAYSILRSIAQVFDGEIAEDAAPVYEVTLAQSSDLGVLVPQLQSRIAELESQITKLTAPVDPSTMSLSELKAYRIGQSKENLSAYLEEHPVASACHSADGETLELYTCTLEKQTLLNNAIAMAEIHNKMGDTEYTPSWNTHNGECTYDWTLDQLVQLAIEIETFVKPLISKQQAMESAINAATTAAEVNAVVITFAEATVIE